MITCCLVAKDGATSALSPVSFVGRSGSDVLYRTSPVGILISTNKRFGPLPIFAKVRQRLSPKV
jgi:hypothetical protein